MVYSHKVFKPLTDVNITYGLKIQGKFFHHKMLLLLLLLILVINNRIKKANWQSGHVREHSLTYY